MVALPARHVERAHAVGAHVAEGYWRSYLRSRSNAHAAEHTGGALALGKMPGLTARLVPGMHTEPYAMARGGPAGEPEARGYPSSEARRGAACLTLLAHCSARSWEWGHGRFRRKLP
jgi:hypothetical protein